MVCRQRRKKPDPFAEPAIGREQKSNPEKQAESRQRESSNPKRQTRKGSAHPYLSPPKLEVAQNTGDSSLSRSDLGGLSSHYRGGSRAMLKERIIEESTKPWSSLTVVVPKLSGSLHLCNIFQRLNQISDFDSYPFPQVEDLMEFIGKAQFLSTLNLTKGYWQVALFPDTDPKTTFLTSSSHWQY
ncbi:hypothetical protein QTP70_019264 [Hemibagrus guttatus]|uniref:Transposon Ty3-I Gag-Pol polyprotein n=1 Tax=Hemibagrus guttatus TaxID=175788 RepID=A0AAE0UH74_9TELE|nr:hypothetical protein QTP70_019264 [Hemibagrus guttatus]KAK3520902.1 hypothetical protein QTP86_016924 [Hemibagrus guttatus]